MKKTLFALQVFGVMALFPIYVALEMNHGTGSFPGTKNHPVVIENAEKNILRVSPDAETQTESAKPVSKNEIIKALFKAY